MSQDLVGAVGSIVITGASSFFTGAIRSVSAYNLSREEFNLTPGSATSGGGTFAYSRTVDATLECEINWAPDVNPHTVLALDPAQVDITFLNATGTVHRYSAGKLYNFSASLPGGGNITGNASIRLAGTFTENPV